MKNYQLEETSEIPNCEMQKIKTIFSKSHFTKGSKSPLKNKHKGISASLTGNNLSLKKLLHKTPFDEESKKESEIVPISQNYNGFSQLPIDEINNRRYDPFNINKYKDLFKNRYINDNGNNDHSINNLRLSTQKSIDIKSFLHESEKISHLQSKRSANLGNDNKIVIKYSSLYIQKLQKAILLFNSKKYEESYNYLLNKTIIYNEQEFATLLLLTNGFDKFEIGNFLSKPKAPNVDYQLLKVFIGNMSFKNLEFTKAFRFLLSRLNMPQDSGLMLQIIEVFSKCFYEDNKEQGHYKDDTAVYILSSTSLAINTMLHKTDIGAIKVISKEQFIAMNNKIPSAIIDKVYEEIKARKLDIVYDYTEMFNKRLGKIINVQNEEMLRSLTHNSNSNTNIDNGIIPNLSMVHRDEAQIENIEGEELIKYLKTGNKFLKYCAKSNSHFRQVFLSNNEASIKWMKMSCCKYFHCAKSINIEDIIDVYYGSGHSIVFDRAMISPELDQYCFTIESSKRTIDLRNDNIDISNKWYKGIKYLLQKRMTPKNKYPTIFSACVEEKITLIWENEIISNWSFFRNLLMSNDKFTIDKGYVLHKKSLMNKLQNVSKCKKGFINPRNKNDFVFIYLNYGIPLPYRQKVWRIVIGNKMNVTEEMLSKAITISMSQIEHNQMEKDLSKIITLLNHFTTQENKINEKVFTLNAIHIMQAFTQIRSDIVYSKNFAYFISIFLLHSNSLYEAYQLFINFLYYKCDFVMKFALRDDHFIKSRIDFFDSIFKATLPKLFRHFHDFDISTNLFFYNWYEFLFAKYFEKNYLILLKVWDIFLVKGEVLIFEIGIVLLKLLEKKFLNLSIKDILKDLKEFSEDSVKEKELIIVMQEIDLSDKYNAMIRDDLIIREKTILNKKNNA